MQNLQISKGADEKRAVSCPHRLREQAAAATKTSKDLQSEYKHKKAAAQAARAQAAAAELQAQALELASVQQEGSAAQRQYMTSVNLQPLILTIPWCCLIT